MATEEIKTEYLIWRIDRTSDVGRYSEWAAAHPVMVAVRCSGFHMQDHLSLEHAAQIHAALGEILAVGD